MAEAVTTSEAFGAKGNKDLYLREWVDGAYADAVSHIRGLMEISVNYTQEKTDIAADDDPSCLTEEGPVTGEGELKLTGLKLADFEKFFSVKTNAAGGVSIGSYERSRYFGFAFKSKCTDRSQDYYCIQKVRFDFPALKTKSLGLTAPELNEYVIPFKCFPIFYLDADGEEERTTANYFNSRLHSAVWPQIKNTVYDPAHTYTVTPAV